MSLTQNEMISVSKRLAFFAPEGDCLCLRRRPPLSQGHIVFLCSRKELHLSQKEAALVSGRHCLGCRKKGCLFLRNHFAVLQEDNRLCHIGRLPVSQGKICFLCSSGKLRFSYRETAGVSGRQCQNKISSVSERRRFFCFGTNSLCLTRTLLLPWEDIVFVSA